jgi:L-fuconolactonase
MPSIIDIHPHVIATDTTRYPLAPLGGTQSTWSRDRPTSFETMIKEMDAAGVAKSAIVQASTAYGHDNSYVAEAIAAHPKRFTGVFSVDVLAPDAVEKMKHWIGLGFSGMRLFTTGSTMPGQATWFDDPRSYPAWEYAGAAGLPVCMQMTPQGFPQLRGLMERFPKVRIILDHLARPQLVDGPPFTADQPFFDLARYGQVFLKVTPVNVDAKDWGKATPETFFGAVIKTFGASRVAWGSNFPATAGPLADILERAQAAFAFASAAEREWIFGKTAQALYPRLAD